MDVAYAKQQVVDALLAANNVYNTLGSAATTAVSTNRFGDTSMRIDIESEAAVIHHLQRSNINFVLRSEEHGNLPATNLSTPSFLAVIDGLDGSSAFKKYPAQSWAGCMFALFQNDNPCYDDYLAAGIIHHSTGRLVIAAKDQGVHMIDIAGKSETPVEPRTFNNADLPVCVDVCNFKPNDPIAAYGSLEHALQGAIVSLGYDTVSFSSTAEGFTRHLLGESLAVVESTRKGNLEFATAYALIHEAGGDFIDLETVGDIGAELFLQYGQTSHKPIIASVLPGQATALAASMTKIKHHYDNKFLANKGIDY